MGKNEIAKGFDKSAKVTKSLFIFFTITLCSLTANVSAESFYFSGKVGNKSTLIPFSGPVQKKVGVRTNETIGSRNLEINSSPLHDEESRYRNYILEILPNLQTLRVRFEDSRYNDTKGIVDLRELINEAIGKVQQLAESDQGTWAERYHAIMEEEAPKFVQRLHQIGGTLSTHLANRLGKFEWPE